MKPKLVEKVAVVERVFSDARPIMEALIKTGKYHGKNGALIPDENGKPVVAFDAFYLAILLMEQCRQGVKEIEKSNSSLFKN